MLETIHYPFSPILERLALALALGLVVGLERERRNKEAGLRTFAFATLLGALGGLLGEATTLAALALSAVLAVFLNLQSLRSRQVAELTTSAALFLMVFAGVLCGQGHRLTPSALAVGTAALLTWKRPLAGFSQALSETELRSAILLAILAFVIYPALPVGKVDRWDLVDLRGALVIVILIAGIGFANYVLLKVYGTRGIDLAGFLGGLVNSTVTVSEMAIRVRETAGALAGAAYRGVMLATAAMLLRNAVLLALVAPAALLVAWPPFALMFAAAALLALRRRPTGAAASQGADAAASGVVAMAAPGAAPGMAVGDAPAPSEAAATSGAPAAAAHDATAVNGEAAPAIRLESPFSIRAALQLGLLFVGLQVAGTLAQRTLGELGFYSVSAVGGLLSSSSAVASAAALAAQHTISPWVAGTGAFLASLTSAVVNWPLIARLSRSDRLKHEVAWSLGLLAVLGVLGFAASAWMGGWARP